MKSIRFEALRVTVGVFFVSLLLLASAVQAQTVITADAGGPYNTSVGVMATYNGSASQPAEGGSIVSYDWDFGDGGTATGEIVTYTYTEDGVFDVTLTVTADNDETDDDVTEATVGQNNLPPVADAGGPYGGSIDNAVAFDAGGSTDDGSIVRYDWEWGDGGGSADTGVTTTHTYLTEEVFNANLTVTDDGNLQNSNGTQVTITAANLPPTADAGGPYNGVVDVAVAFDGTGSVDPEGQISSYDWDGVMAQTPIKMPGQRRAISILRVAYAL